MESIRSTPHTNSVRLAHRLTVDYNNNNISVKDVGDLNSLEDDTTVLGEDGLSPSAPLNIDEIFQVQSLENNSTISMSGYAETFISSFKQCLTSCNEQKPLFSLQGLPNLYMPLNYFETVTNEQSLYGFF